jgi:hypothetical protein
MPLRGITRTAIGGAAVFAVLFLSAACATGARPASGEPEVLCTMLTSWDLGSYGANSATNPFLAPSGLIEGTPDEFVALDIALSLPDSATLSIDAAVRRAGENGEIVARLYSLQDMRKYWRAWGDPSAQTSRTRLDTLERWYAPSSQFVAHKGRSEYVIVLVGKNPLPRPASATVSIALNGKVGGTFEFPLPKGSK